MPDSLGKIAFDAYNRSTGGKTFDGREIPPWERVCDEKPHVAMAWNEAAAAIRAVALNEAAEVARTWGDAPPRAGGRRDALAAAIRSLGGGK
jgi:hypothetical protein